MSASSGAGQPGGRRFFLVGGAGFIGSHLADRLLADANVQRVVLYDNLTAGREWHYAHHYNDARFAVIHGDVKDFQSLASSMAGSDVVVHLASNPDIARALTEPDIDFREGTLLTQNVLEAMRTTNVGTLLYASGSGVYGDLGETEASEDHGPLCPISTYGASKLAGEAMISAYAHMFGLRGRIYRFANVVGARQTHGVGFDFVRRLLRNPKQLRILGDGTQSKSYIAVDDVIDAILIANERTTTAVATYNVATGDYITVHEIAQLALDVVGVAAGETKFEFSGGVKGWKGDVPVVRLNTDRIRALGWSNRLSTRDALRRSMEALVVEARAGRLESPEALIEKRPP